MVTSKKIMELFFKVRYVYCINNNTIKPIEKNGDVELAHFDFQKNSKEDLQQILNNIISPNRVERYLARYDNNNDWELIVAYYNNKPVGTLWILNIKRPKFKFDSFIHDTNQVLIGGVYVNEKYRGRGIYGLMQYNAYKYIKSKFPGKTVLLVVEKNNYSSIRSNEKFGAEVYGVNYLLKLFGKNIISIFKHSKGINIWLLKRYKQTHY